MTHASNQTVEYCSSVEALHALIAYLQAAASLPVAAAGKRKAISDGAAAVGCVSPCNHATCKSQHATGAEPFEGSALPFMLENEASIAAFLLAAAKDHVETTAYGQYSNKYARAKPSALLTAILTKKANEALQVCRISCQRCHCTALL